MGERVSVAAPDFETFLAACRAAGVGAQEARWLRQTADLESAAGKVWLPDAAGPFEAGFLVALFAAADRGEITLRRV